MRYGFAQTATHFYVFGGVDNGAITNAVNRMDLSTGNWEPRAAMPIAGEAPTCALDATCRYRLLHGRFERNGFFSYDIATDTWTPLLHPSVGSPTVLHQVRSMARCLSWVGRVVLHNAVWVYDIGTNTGRPDGSATCPFLLAGYHAGGSIPVRSGRLRPDFR